MKRHFYLGLGWLFVGLGTLGIFLPLLPTVVFYILAAALFARSSPAMERKLLNHPYYGYHLRAWREHRAVARSGKIAATLVFLFSTLVSYIFAPPYIFLFPLGAGLIIGGWLWTRPEPVDKPANPLDKEQEQEQEQEQN